MGKISKEDAARLEGMRLAYEIAKEHGVEGLEAEVRWRGALNVCPQIKADKIYSVVDQVVERHKMQLGAASAWALSEKMHLPVSMIEMFLEGMNERFEMYKEDKDLLDRDEKLMFGDTIMVDMTKKFTKEEKADGSYRIVKRG